MTSNRGRLNPHVLVGATVTATLCTSAPHRMGSSRQRQWHRRSRGAASRQREGIKGSAWARPWSQLCLGMLSAVVCDKPAESNFQQRPDRCVESLVMLVICTICTGILPLEGTSCSGVARWARAVLHWEVLHWHHNAVPPRGQSLLTHVTRHPGHNLAVASEVDHRCGRGGCSAGGSRGLELADTCREASSRAILQWRRTVDGGGGRGVLQCWRHWQPSGGRLAGSFQPSVEKSSSHLLGSLQVLCRWGCLYVAAVACGMGHGAWR